MLVAKGTRTLDDARMPTEPSEQTVTGDRGPSLWCADGELQLARIRRLASFALDIAGIIELEDVLAKACRALLEQFEFDQVAIVQLDASQPVAATLGGNTVMLDEHTWNALKDIRGVTVDTARAPTAISLLATVDQLGIGPTSAAQSVTWIPVRPTAGDLIVLCGWTSQTASSHRDVPQVELIPFLELFGEHIRRAIDSAECTSELRRQRAELAESNGCLQTNLEELERTQAQLVEAKKLEALGRLASGIAHDFNNLLTVIVTHAHLIQPAIAAHSEANADLEIVVDAAMRAAEITHRLLAFSRQHKSQCGIVDLNAIAIELSQTVQRSLRRDIVVELDLDPSVARVRADLSDLGQVLTNLVVNATEAMPNGGKLTIQTRHASSDDKTAVDIDPSASLIALCVSDSGIGMSEETRRQLFEPFFTTKPVGAGSGLGLAAVYGLVTKNEGRIHVTSTVGQGSCFTVLLPSADGLYGADLHAPAAKARRCILVVEDEPAIRRMICRVLRKAEFEVAEANDGEQALEVARRLPGLDLVITDVSMPSVSGPELVGRLRKFLPRLRVVFMSGFTFDRLDVSSLDGSIERFLAKPFTPDQLAAAVETAFTITEQSPG